MPWIPDTIRGVSFNVVEINLTIQVLKKPVVYTQFDRESFFEGHLYSEGYFSYEEDGFGPIEYNYEDTVQRIISYIETGCKMEDKYQARVTSFFKYVDTNNCERVYKAITEI